MASCDKLHQITLHMLNFEVLVTFKKLLMYFIVITIKNLHLCKISFSQIYVNCEKINVKIQDG